MTRGKEQLLLYHENLSLIRSTCITSKVSANNFNPNSEGSNIFWILSTHTYVRSRQTHSFKTHKVILTILSSGHNSNKPC